MGALNLILYERLCKVTKSELSGASTHWIERFVKHHKFHLASPKQPDSRSEVADDKLHNRSQCRDSLQGIVRDGICKMTETRCRLTFRNCPVSRPSVPSSPLVPSPQFLSPHIRQTSVILADFFAVPGGVPRFSWPELDECQSARKIYKGNGIAFAARMNYSIPNGQPKQILHVP